MSKEKKPKPKKNKDTEEKKEESEYDGMDLEMLREVVPMLRQQLEKSMLERNYVQLERDAIQQYFDISKREVREIELAILAKDREMELLEDNHRVELRVYQQKVKHLEYEHKNNLKSIVRDGASSLDTEESSHENKERELLKEKEDLKIKQMQKELLNAQAVANFRQNQERQLIKLRQQFDEGLDELSTRCEQRLKQLELDLELRRRVEVHEVEERKSQHINDLVQNHENAFGQMKTYYNDITRNNLKLIQKLKTSIAQLRERAKGNKQTYQELVQENLRLSEPLARVENDISEVRSQLKERTKDQMALVNAKARLSTLTRTSETLRQKLQELEREHSSVQQQRDFLYNSFEETLQRVQHQSEFQNQALEQRLRVVEANAEQTAAQVQEIMRAAGLDVSEMNRVMATLDQMLVAKDDALSDARFQLLKLQKAFNDSYEAAHFRLRELGVPEEEIRSLGFRKEPLASGGTSGPAGLIALSFSY